MSRYRSETTNTSPHSMTALQAAEKIEATFREFVRNALLAPPAVLAEPDAGDSTAKVLPLLRRKKVGGRRETTVRMQRPPPKKAPGPDEPTPAATGAAPRRPVPRPPPTPVRSEETARRHQDEVVRVVPEVARVLRKVAGPREAAEDGQMPAAELDRFLTEMGVLIKYGHEPQVQAELEQVVHRYSRDLLLLRRLAEFHLERSENDRAIDVLFRLASGLFDRKNVEGMRAALEQVLQLAPGNKRAMRLLGLLERR